MFVCGGSHSPRELDWGPAALKIERSFHSPGFTSGREWRREIQKSEIFCFNSRGGMQKSGLSAVRAKLPVARALFFIVMVKLSWVKGSLA
jgi:hypothetical protein